MNVEPAQDIKKLDLVTERPDLRRDLHVYVDYVREREVKRAQRGNMLQKTDARRLAKLLSDPDADEEIVESGCSYWVDFVDECALQLGFVEYDTQGTYAGYTSHEPSFPDNFIRFNIKAYDDFCQNSLTRQETILREKLLEQYVGSASEFFSNRWVSRLDHFSQWGSATGVIPLLDFPKARRFLLKLLAELPTGEWLSTASLIAFVKKHHRYFLIPEKPIFKSSWEKDRTRYDNFLEGQQNLGRGVAVKPSDPDAFERVEGRYVERFLEWIPMLLGYVDIGYSKQKQETFPMLGGLPVFRVSERLRRTLDGTLAEPTVKVTPTFEVYVQSEFYPARVVSRVRQIGELISADKTFVYRLTKQTVAAAQAADPQLNVINLLESLSTSPLPDNVRSELDAWSEHSEKFVLYSGFSLLETEPDVKLPDRTQVECISPEMYIVKSPDRVFNELEQQERMPFKVTHGEDQFSSLSDGVRNSLRGKNRKSAKPTASKPHITLMKLTHVQLICPDREFLQRLKSVLIGAGCPVEADGKNLSLLYSDRYETEVIQAIREMRADYQVTIQNKCKSQNGSLSPGKSVNRTK